MTMPPTSAAAAQVAAFHQMIGSPPWPGPVADMPADTIQVRNTLVEDEVRELVEATLAGDVAAIARELADVLYVVYGTAYTYGIPLDAVVTAVHKANMTRTPTVSGKAVKGPGYIAPDVAGVLAATARAELLRYPAARPGWLGEDQPWPCGDCMSEVAEGELHACVPTDQVPTRIVAGP